MSPYLIAVAALALLPDIDSVVGVLAGDLSRYHNNVTHSVFVGAAVAVLVGWLASIRSSPAWPAVVVAFVCYQSHLLLDYLTVGRGIMALWPLSAERFQSPVPLFVGVRHSAGLLSWMHLPTVVNEAAFLVAIRWALHWHARRRSRRAAPRHALPYRDPARSATQKALRPDQV